MFISYLFIFLLVLESVAFIVLGAWHLTIPRLQNVLIISGAIYRRELAFGILLVILGSLGILISIVGLIATFTLRLTLLRIVRRKMCRRYYFFIDLVCIMFMVCDAFWDNHWYYWHYFCM
jgi:hypothetical protein